MRAEQLAAAHPGRVVLIGVHAGYYADPTTGQPDFRTPYGDTLDNFAGVAAYPSGDMNRLVWPGAYNQQPYFPQNPPNQMAIRRPGWWDTGYPGQGAGEFIILNGGNSPVNIGASSAWNSVTRECSITVELYYTGNDSAAANHLNVVFTESNIIAYQSGGGNNYQHNHVLREMITGQWGNNISPTTQGTFITNNYSYIVPANFNIDYCHISVFVTRDDNTHTSTGIVIPAKNGTTGINETSVAASELNIFPNPADESSQLSFFLQDAENVSMEVFNIIGAKAAAWDAGEFSPGLHVINFENIFPAHNLSSGLYLLKLKAGISEQVLKFAVK